MGKFFSKVRFGLENKYDFSRGPNEYRECRVDFGSEFGVCIASIGGTRKDF